jgi:hypothetical protein
MRPAIGAVMRRAVHNQRPSGVKQPAPQNKNMSVSAPNTVEADSAAASGGVVINGGSKLEALREQLAKDERNFDDFIGNAGKEEQVCLSLPKPLRPTCLRGFGIFCLRGNLSPDERDAGGAATLKICAHVDHHSCAWTSARTALSLRRLHACAKKRSEHLSMSGWADTVVVAACW